MGSRELEVVRSVELKAVLLRMIEEHERDRPNHMAENRAVGTAVFISGREWISNATGVSIRAMWVILEDKSEYTSLSMADRLLSGLELTHLWGHEVHVIPNPNVNTKNRERLMRQRLAES